MDVISSTASSKPSSSTRLMITKMILENFKSYAGVQEIGPFHKRFSSIVGPNGSGKSNVIDALLFVFAKKASQLRLKKVSELIHKSSGFPNLQYAQVSVYFQLIHDDESSEDDFEVVSGSEFVISRIAYSDNTSKYTVNSKNSTATEVKKLLDSYGIDLDNNRFLILQGEVEQIAMMKPKASSPNEDGLLEYLEDIIGSNRYVERIEEVSKSLDAINEQRLERVNRLKLAERDRDNLSGSKAEAENYLEKERDIRRKQNILYQAMEGIAGKNVHDFQERLEKLDEKISKEKAKRAEYDAKLKEMEKQYKQAHNEYNEVDSELQKATSDFAAFERRDVKLQEDMKHNSAQLKKTQTSLAKESKKEEESSSAIRRLQSQLEAGRRSVEEITTKKAEEEAKIEEIMASLQDATKSLREKLEVAQVHLAEAERRVASFQSEKEVVSTRIQLLKSRADAATSGVQSIQQKLDSLEQDRLSARNRIQELEAETKELNKLIAAGEKQRTVLHEKETLIQGKLRQSRDDVEDLKARYANQGKNGATGVVAAIMKACGPRGPLAKAGVHGRLGDLAVIDPEFDTAISTACGMLDNIVVETTEGAQMCLAFLKENNLGRATFILLDQMNEWKTRMTTPFRVPAGTHRLFDVIVSSKEIYLPAFYMALKDTLVANDLDAATAIAYVGDRAVHRVVTRTGDLIDTSGAMSGGGKEAKSGGMKLKSGANPNRAQSREDEVTPELIKSYEDKVEALVAELQQCRADRENNEVSLKEMKTRLKTCATDIDKQNAVVSALIEQEPDLQSRLQRIMAETQLTPAEQREIVDLEKELQRLDVEMDRASPDLRSHKLEVSNIQQQIRDVGGPRLGKAQARLDLLSTQFDKLTKDLSSYEVEESNHVKQAAKAQAAREKLEKELAKLESKLKELLKEQQDMEQDALLVAEAVEAAKAKMADTEKELGSIKSSFDKMKADVKRIEIVEVDLQNELEDTNKGLQEHLSTASAWKRKLEAVRKAHIDEQKDFQSSIESAIGNSSVVVKEFLSKEIESLHDLTEELLEKAIGDVESLKKELSILEAEKQRLQSSVNMNDLIEYLKKDAQYRVRVAELEAITEERNNIRKEYEEIRRKRLEEFMTGFGIISLKLKEMYQMITLGGDAELELVDSLDPFSEGIVFTVRPKNKSWKNISNLSGGEKTLSSLALVFALHHYKPTPLYVMDEIDAALDFKNVSIVANYIKDRTKNAQFVIISLRNNMFELADRLVGIYKTHDATKSVTINPKLISAEAMRADHEDSRSEAEVVDTDQVVLKPGVKSHGRKALADATNIKV